MIAEPDARGKNLGREAVRLMLRYGMDVLHLKRFIAKISILNDASLHLFTTVLGFHKISESAYFREVTLKFCADTSKPHVLSQLPEHTYLLQHFP